MTGEQLFDLIKMAYHNNNFPIINVYSDLSNIHKNVLSEAASKLLLKESPFCSCPNGGWLTKDNKKVCLTCSMEVL